MYEYLRHLLEMSDNVGRAEKIYMGPWISDSERISIEGTTQDGYKYELCLEVKTKREVEHGN